MRGMTFHASPETRRFAFAYSTSPRATGPTSSAQLRRVHLVVGRHDARDVHLLVERRPIARRDGRADAPLRSWRRSGRARLRPPPPLPTCRRARRRRRRRPIDELGDAADRLADEPLLVERGHDDRDPLAVEHQAVGGAAPCRRAAIGSTTSAAMAPRIRPMSAPTSSDERLDRAVVLLATAGSTTRLDSTSLREIQELTATRRGCSWIAARLASAVVITEFRLAVTRSR